MDYKKAALAAERMGFNPVFDVEIPEACKLEIKKTEDKQVKVLVEWKVAFSE